MRLLKTTTILLGLLLVAGGCSHWPTLKTPVGATSDGRVTSYWSGTPWSLPAFTGTGLTTYRVVAGDTLSKIARDHDTTVEKLMELNALGNPNALSTGMVLYLDTLRGNARVDSRPRVATTNSSSGASAKPERANNAHVKYPMRWPVTGNVTTKFGKKKAGAPHDGIDISAPKGSPVKAAQKGKVVYSDFHGGYGNLVIVKHGSGLVSVYAHNMKNLVKKGDPVSQGQVIAYVGDTGKIAGPHLHFEIRRGASPKNPLNFLPPDH